MPDLLKLAARTDEHNAGVVMDILVHTCTASSALVRGDYASHVSAIKEVGSVLDSLLNAADECLPKPKLASRLLWIDFCVGQLVLVLHEALAVGVEWPAPTPLRESQANWLALIRAQRKGLARLGKNATLVLCPFLLGPAVSLDLRPVFAFLSSVCYTITTEWIYT